MLGELVHALGEAKKDHRCHVVVLGAAGAVFSSGGDLTMLSGARAEPGDIAHASLVTVLTKMHRLGKPIIAKVQGPALGGGLGLVTACDIAIASEKATFGTTEIKLGLWPMMISAELVRNVGRKKALELMLTGKNIDAAEAERIGLITHCVPESAVDAVVQGLATDLANLSPSTLARGLRSFYETQDSHYEAALIDLEKRLAVLLKTADACEGLVAFLQHREPKWVGK